MPMDHNVKTAYFVVPKDVKHGTELLCSYFGCRGAGIKFRYCIHCKLPVAKRNFAKRHRHNKGGNGDKISASDDDDDDIDNEDDGTGTSGSTDTQNDQPTGMVVTATATASTSSHANLWNSKELILRELLKSKKNSKKNNGSNKNNKEQTQQLTRDELSKLITDRQKTWSELLLQRPQSSSSSSSGQI